MASRQQKQTVAALVLGGIALAVGVAALVLFLLDPDEEEPADATPTATATLEPSPRATETPSGDEAFTPAGWTRCTNATEGYSVAYPEDWKTVAPEAEFECQFFDREAFEVEEDTEFPLTDLVVDQTEEDFERVVDGFSENARLIASESTEVDRYAATVVEVEATGEGLYPEGTRTYAYVVDRRGRAFVVRTTVPPEEDDYIANRRIVDEVVDTVRFL